jgi:integrase
MHQLWRHDNGNWYVLYGPRLKKRISAQTKDRREAERFLARFIAVEGEPRGKDVTVGQILDGYETDRKIGVRAPNALKHSVQGLKPALQDLYPSQLTPAAIRRYVAGRGVADGTILREVGTLRAALSWAVENQWISVRPIISNPVSAPPARARWITKEEATALLEGCREPHMRVFIMMALMTVARTGAILEAKWSQVDFKKRTIDFGRGHGNKRRALVPVNDELLRTLVAAHELACSDYIVEFRGKPLTTVKRGFGEACRRATLKDVTPHILRHTGATWMALEGVPLSEIARFLGDSEAVVEAIYAKHTPGYLRRASGALQLRNAS